MNLSQDGTAIVLCAKTITPQEAMQLARELMKLAIEAHRNKQRIEAQL